MVQIKDFPNYVITKNGNVINKITKKELKPIVSRKGYYSLTICNNGIKKSVRVHRLVAENLIPNLKKYKEVNHIDGNKLNNNIENLEWCNRSQNMNHAFENNLWDAHNKVKVINSFNGKTYESIKGASYDAGYSESYLGLMLRGIRKNKTTFNIL